MTNNLLVRVAVGAALASVGVSAFALTPNEVPEANRVYIGGATATDNVLRDVFINAAVGLCQPGTIDVYEGAPNQRAVLCRAKTGLGSAFNLIQGQPVGYIKESTGGSGNGTQPVANQTNLQFMNLGTTATSHNCASSQANVSLGAGLSTVTLRTGCNNTPLSRPPGAGIADVEGRLLFATEAEQARLSPVGLTDVVFGVPVSTPFYRALQAAQGLTQNDDCTNTPNLTKRQVAAMFSGFIGSAAQLVSANNGDIGTALPDKPIYICRRGDSSGTQAGTEAYFLRQRCEGGVNAFLTPDESLCLTNGCSWPAQAGVSFQDNLVYAGSGSGQVRSCLDFHGTSARNDFAIGVLSTESNPFSGAGLNFRYVRVDGALSTLEQTANGQWDFFTSNVLNRRNPNVLSNLQNQVVNYFVTNVGNPAFIVGINSPFQNNVCLNGGNGGVLAVAGTPLPSGVEAPFSAAEMNIGPINSGTKQPLGVINNCQPAIQQSESAAGGQFRATVPTF